MNASAIISFYEVLRLEETNKMINNNVLNIARLIFFLPAGFLVGLLSGSLSGLFFRLIWTSQGAIPFGIVLPVVITDSITSLVINTSAFWSCVLVSDFLRPTFLKIKVFKIIFAFLTGCLVVGTFPAFTTTEISHTRLWIEMISPILVYFLGVFPMKKPIYERN